MKNATFASVTALLMAAALPAVATPGTLHTAASACHVLSGTVTFTSRGYASNESTTTPVVLDCPLAYESDESTTSVQFIALVRSNGTAYPGQSLSCTYSIEDPVNDAFHALTASTRAAAKTYLDVYLDTFPFAYLLPARARCTIPVKIGTNVPYIAGFQAVSSSS
jgi:hypothetical protein